VLELAADNRIASLEKGARSASTIAPEVEHTHPRGWRSTSTTRRTAAAIGAARCGGADIRSAAAGKPCTGDFVKTSVPVTFEFEASIWLSHPTSPLVGTRRRHECLMRCARVIVKAHRPYRRPHGNVSHKGRARAVLYQTSHGSRP
jgi:hypothetical protein